VDTVDDGDVKDEDTNRRDVGYAYHHDMGGCDVGNGCGCDGDGCDANDEYGDVAGGNVDECVYDAYS